MTINVARTISVQVDDETFVRLEHAIQTASDAIGMRVSKSVFLRQLVARGLDDPRPLFDRGFIEGYMAAFGASMRTIAENLQRIAADPSQIPGLLGLGMASPYDERERGGSSE